MRFLALKMQIAHIHYGANRLCQDFKFILKCMWLSLDLIEMQIYSHFAISKYYTKISCFFSMINVKDTL
jgi:hypothetical protein